MVPKWPQKGRRDSPILTSRPILPNFRGLDPAFHPNDQQGYDLLIYYFLVNGGENVCVWGLFKSISQLISSATFAKWGLRGIGALFTPGGEGSEQDVAQDVRPWASCATNGAPKYSPTAAPLTGRPAPR